MPYFDYQQHRIFYREQGAGPLLVVLPGNTASSICHQGELAYFSDRYRVVSLDYVGTGQSGRLKVWPDDWWRQGAHQVNALLAHLEVDAALLMGTSGGAIIALLTAILYPERVRALIADSCVERFSAEMIQQNIIEDRSRRTQGQIAFWQHAQGEDWEAVVEADSDVLRRLGESGGDWLDGRLKEIQCPVLFTASLKDDGLPDVAAQNCGMAVQVPNSRLFLNNEGGHPLMWSRPQDFRPISDYFLAAIEQT